MDFTLVMSASINPNGMHDMSKESLTNREDQYIKTLRFYNAQPSINNILFVENSNWDLSRVKCEVGESVKISYLSLDANSYPREWGKGYGEFYLMDKAVDWLADHRKDDVILKVTGRFPILNISRMVKEFEARKNLKLAVDVVNHPFYDLFRLGWSGHHCRTIIYAVTQDFYKGHLYGRYKDVRESDGKIWGAETLMYIVWQSTRNCPGVYPRFKHEPELSGFSGGRNHAWITANNYDGLLSRGKRLLRQMVRVVFPFLWL